MQVWLWKNEVVFSEEYIIKGWHRNNPQILKERKTLATLYGDSKIVNLSCRVEEELYDLDLGHCLYGVDSQQESLNKCLMASKYEPTVGYI